MNPGQQPNQQQANQQQPNQQAGNQQQANQAAPNPQPQGKTQQQQDIENYIQLTRLQQSNARIQQAANQQGANQQQSKNRRTRENLNAIGGIVDDTNEALGGVSNQVGNAFSQLQITAGLGIAMGVLFVLIWLLIPNSSGHTRAQLLWLTVLGQTKLSTDQSLQPQLNPTDLTVQQSQQQPTPLGGVSPEQIISSTAEVLPLTTLPNVNFDGLANYI